jgi:serine-type D-Ala-D-Ala carboxypeptidase/endopeptidase
MKKLSIVSFITFIAVALFCFSGCAGKSTNVSIKEEAGAKINAISYAAYEGKYQLAPNFIITISKKGDSLLAQATGQGSAEIYPESKDKFYYKVVAAKIKFNRNSEGNVESLTLFQNGQQMPAKKLNI